MTRSAYLSRRSFAVMAAASLLQGCQSVDHKSPHQCGQCGMCEHCVGSDMRRRHPKGVMLSSPSDPEVVVIGYDCPPTLTFELQHLAEEIRRGLATRGGLRLRECPPMPPAPDCDAVTNSGPGCRTASSAGIHQVGYQQPQPVPLILPPVEPGPDGFAIPPVPPSNDVVEMTPQALAFSPSPAFPQSLPPATEVRVVIHGFRPYRPMQLDVTITVLDVVSGREITAIQGLWNAKEPVEPIADASPVLRRALKHPPPRANLEASTLAGLSPRLFLSSVAKEVVPPLHAACLSNTSSATAAGW